MKTKLYLASTSVLVSALLAGSVSQARTINFVKEDLEKLLGHAPKVTNLLTAQQMGLDRGSSSTQPWSGNQWPDLAGGIADHYRIHKHVQKLKKGWDFTKDRLFEDQANVAKGVRTWNTQQIAQNLSPSEKYDLLLGDLKFTFTQRIVKEIEFRTKTKSYLKINMYAAPFRLSDVQGVNNQNFLTDVDSKGQACTMTGGSPTAYKGLDEQRGYSYWSTESGGWVTPDTNLNYGWAGASVFLPRPTKAVVVRGATGQMITFYPEDLKALGSYLFARTTTGPMFSMPLSYSGRPCADPKGPEQDEAGWIKDIRCNDLDPAIFHLALLNRIGVERAPMLMDVDNTAKITNVPVSAYALSYFNPRTGQAGNLSQAKMAIRGAQDVYAKRRSPLAQYLVGVKATVTLVGPHGHENFRTQVKDSAKEDSLYSRTYAYDLELDSQGNILGGEWGDRSADFKQDQKGISYADQPDFIWMGNMLNAPSSEMAGYNTADQWDFSKLRVDPVTKLNSSRPFGAMKWAWNGSSELPKQWKSLAKRDMQLEFPILGTKLEPGKNTSDVMPLDARDSALRSALPYSNIVYYLFDQSRDPGQI